MVRMLFVEGGAHHNGALNTACRRGFKKLLEKADLNDRSPRVIPCWGRATAFREFRIAAENAAKDHKLFLLVDSEEPVKTSSPWSKRLTKRTFLCSHFLGSIGPQEVSRCLARNWSRGVRGAALRIGVI